jgi:hypothetical protein
MSFNEDLFNKLDEFASSPFLFIGSGFSRRYLKAEDWEGLLRKYADELDTPFEKYRSLAGGNWSKVGKLIAKDYHGYWFDSDSKKEERNLHLQDMVDYSSPLKVSIARHLLSLNPENQEEYLSEEIEKLKSAKINGIITTNYDLLCESIFPQFKVYKTQGELIFSALQEVGEIYKIHGCCSEPNSIVITEDDYHEYNSKNAYIAAKLLTVFLEHPTIFMGYSISDENVRTILTSIIACLDQEQVNELSERLFFVQYVPEHEGEPLIDKYEFEIGGGMLPLTRIRTNGYIEVIDVLNQLSQKFPAALLRKMKEHIYELVNTNDPTEKIAVVDFDTETDLEKVDVVIGVGVSGNKEKSYETYTRFDIAEDILYDNKEFDIQELTSKTLPKLVKASTWVPVYKYYVACEDQENLDPKIVSAANKPLADWSKANTYSYKEKSINEQFESIESVLAVNSADKAVKIILLLDLDKIVLEDLEGFLKENFELTKDQQNSSYYMKLVCLYDRLKNG